MFATSRRLVVLSLLLSACRSDEVKPTPNKITAERYRSITYLPPEGVIAAALTVYDDSLYIAGSATHDRELARLFVVEGGPTRGPADYEARKLVLGKLEDAFSPYWKRVASCTGSATIAEDRVVLTLTAPEACARWSGTWTAERAPPPSASVAPEDAGAHAVCHAYRDCQCELARRARDAPPGSKLGTFAKAFAKNCSEATSLLATAVPDDAACTTGLVFAKSLAEELSPAAVPPQCR